MRHEKIATVLLGAISILHFSAQESLAAPVVHIQSKDASATVESDGASYTLTITGASSASIQASAFTMSDPSRLVVDVTGMNSLDAKKNVGGAIAALRAGTHPGKTRIVVDIASGHAAGFQKSVSGSGSVKLSFHIEGGSGAPEKAAPVKASKTETIPPPKPVAIIPAQEKTAAKEPAKVSSLPPAAKKVSAPTKATATPATTTEKVIPTTTIPKPAVTVHEQSIPAKAPSPVAKIEMPQAKPAPQVKPISIPEKKFPSDIIKVPSEKNEPTVAPLKFEAKKPIAPIITAPSENRPSVLSSANSITAAGTPRTSKSQIITAPGQVSAPLTQISPPPRAISSPAGILPPAAKKFDAPVSQLEELDEKKDVYRAGDAPQADTASLLKVENLAFEKTADGSPSVSIHVPGVDTYAFTQTRSYIYELMIENASLGNTSLTTTQFPPQPSQGFEAAVAHQQGRNVVVRLYVTDGVKLAPQKTDENIVVKVIR